MRPSKRARFGRRCAEKSVLEVGLLKFPDWNNSREQEFPGIPQKIPGNSRECQNYYKNTLKPIFSSIGQDFWWIIVLLCFRVKVFIDWSSFEWKKNFEKFRNFRKILVKSPFYYYGKFPGVPGNSKNFPGIYFYGNSREFPGGNSRERNPIIEPSCGQPLFKKWWKFVEVLLAEFYAERLSFWHVLIKSDLVEGKVKSGWKWFLLIWHQILSGKMLLHW